MLPRCLLAGLLLGTVVRPVQAQPDVPPDAALDSLIALLKPYLIDAVPHPVFESSHNWGKQSMSFHGLHWRGLKPKVVKTPRNDGTWRKIRFDVRQWPASLIIKAFDYKEVDAERQTFKVYLSSLAQVEMEQQVWESGVRLYSGSTRARFRLHVTLDCESTLRLDTSKGILPDLIVRLRAAKAVVWYNELVVEHIAGIGGTGAKVLGNLLIETVDALKPSLERKLLEQANRSIVRAADTKEIRLEFSKLTAKKK